VWTEWRHSPSGWRYQQPPSLDMSVHTVGGQSLSSCMLFSITHIRQWISANGLPTVSIRQTIFATQADTLHFFCSTCLNMLSPSHYSIIRIYGQTLLSLNSCEFFLSLFRISKYSRLSITRTAGDQRKLFELSVF